MEKNEIRTVILALRKSMNRERVSENSKIITRKLLSSRYYINSRHIFVYANFENEVETDLIIESALKDGKTVCIPHIPEESSDMLAARYIREDGDLVECKFGIRSVATAVCVTVPPADIDLCIVPGVAFDRKFNRIGFGAGYYDRYLRGLRPGCMVVGLAHDLQIVKEIPTHENDIKMDLIITEKEMLRGVKSIK